MQTWYSQALEEDTASPGTGVTDGCVLPRESWSSNPGPLEEQLEF